MHGRIRTEVMRETCSLARVIAPLAIQLTLILCPTQVGSGEEAGAREDPSLTLHQYYQLGVPRLGLDWGAEQRASARAVLWRLFEERPDQLPRFRSPKSGALFEALLYEEFGAPPVGLEARMRHRTIADSDLRAPHGAARLRTELASQTFLGLYELHPDRADFTRELVELYVYQSEVAAWSLRALYRTGSAPERVREHAEERVAGGGTVEELLELCMSSNLDGGDRIYAYRRARDVVSGFASWLSQEGRSVLEGKLSNCKKAAETVPPRDP